MRKNLPDKNFFIDRNFPNDDSYIITEYIASGNNAHVFRAYSEKLNHSVACKIIPKANIEHLESNPDAWFDEPQKANSLNNSAVVRCDRHFPWKDEVNKIDCLVLCYEFVEGLSLRKFISINQKDISIDFLVRFLKTIFELLHEMKERGIEHGDMHSGNILVQSPDTFQINPQSAFRVTDFGAWVTTDNQKQTDDYEQLAITLKELLVHVNYQEGNAHDRYIYSVLTDEFLSRHLIEQDITRDPLARTPRDLYEKLMRLDNDFEKREKEALEVKLSTPFDYLNCEQIGEAHSILKALYSELFLGLDRIKNRNNLVLTGPRGCGKSTVFKSLSLRHRFLVDDDSPELINYVGIYYRCSDDLYFSFPRYKLPENKQAYELPMHYLTATLLIEVLKTVQMWAERHFSKIFLDGELRASGAIWEILEIDPPNQPGANSFAAIIHKLSKERKRVAKKQRVAHDPNQTYSIYFGADTLLKCCDELTSHFSFLQTIPFFFFIDDYSSPKITEQLQENLNRLLMHRSSSCFFKLSTESPVSYAHKDIDGKIFVEGREFNLVNLGEIFLHEENDRKLRFIEDVFSRRFQAIDNYPVADLESLLGTNKIVHTQVAREIRDKKKFELWGKESLSYLCSGDIHYIITLVGNMVDSIGGHDGLSKVDTQPKISIRLQNKSIRNEAGYFLSQLKGVPKGDKLVKIVNAFGAVAKSFLLYRNSKNESTNPPWQTSRIEPYDDLALSNEAEGLLNELLRYSVFILDMRGKSRRGKTVPRLYLRRFLIPHFNLTFSKRDPLELENSKVEELLMFPDKFEKDMKITGPDKENTDKGQIPFQLEHKKDKD